MPSTPRKKLGRGLDSLLKQPPVSVDQRDEGASSSPDSSVDEGDGLRFIPVDAVTPSPFQPRHAFDEKELESLAASIHQSGLLQPIVVRRIEEGEVARYELIAGERRWRAGRMAGFTELPAVVRDADDETAAGLALIENLQRTDLNAVERADALRSLQDRFGLTHGQIAERVGMDRSSIANLIRTTELEEPIRALVASGNLTGGHAKALLAVSPGSRRVSLAERAARDGWTVRRLEREARAATDAGTQAPRASGGVKEPSPDLRRLELLVSEQLGARVSIRVSHARERGEIAVGFHDYEHFEAVLSRMGIDTHGM